MPLRAPVAVDVIASDSRADTPHLHHDTRHMRYMRTRALVILHYPSLTRTDLEIWPGPNRLQKKIKLKKKRKRKSFDKVELWLWPKSQNFQKGPVPLSFFSTFWFWDPFLHLKLWNCANCPIPKKLTFAQILTKKSKFSRSTCLAQFFV